MDKLQFNFRNRALYAHRIHSAWWQNPDKPEQFGFLSASFSFTGIS